MNRIRVHEPEVADHGVTFSWDVDPKSALYRRTTFRLQFPDDVPLRDVPIALWRMLALLCLHSHFALLRPCRVELPGALAPGEREFWLRLVDAAVATLEACRGGSDRARRVDLVDGPGPHAPPRQARDAGRVVTAFSGGKDSLLQLGLLSELGERPIAVATTSPRPPLHDHLTPRRRAVLAEVEKRRDVELVEVRSDFRAAWDNDFPRRAGQRVSVNEITDTFLYLAAALVVGFVRGAPRVFLASEAELQETALRDGVVVQHPHFMYSAVTQCALDALLARFGLRHGSTNYPLRSAQVQRLLWTRYPDLRDLQYSCWRVGPDAAACSACSQCLRVALTALAAGGSPAEIGIDLRRLLVSMQKWKPATGNGDGLPDARVKAALDGEILRDLAAVSPRSIVRRLLGDAPHGTGDPGLARALLAYATLRRRLRGRAAPTPGYRRAYLALVDERYRERLAAVFDAAFGATDPDDDAAALARTRALAEWIAAPLRAGGARDDVLAPQELTAAELDGIRQLVPGPEPELGVPVPEGAESVPAGPLRVCETLLDGNERRYVDECFATNMISSAGAFVERFEAAFAAAVGCRHGIACSSGTAALHLALAAVGVGEGDEVLMPAFTMIATANAVRLLGATPVLVDAEPDTWNLATGQLAAKLTPRTRAIVPVHIYGHPVDMDPLRDLAERHGLGVIEDAAEAHGAVYRGRPVGSLGDAAAFSFYGNKLVTTGEGGMVTTNDPALAARARELRSLAFSSDRHFWHRSVAFNYRMSNLQAAVGLAQTERLAELVERRRRNRERYALALSDVPGLGLPVERPGCRNVFWMFGLTVLEGFGPSRDALRRHLAARGVETRSFFVPIHVQPAYFRRHAGERHPVAERLGATGLYLPSGPTLSQADIEYVARQIRRARA
jgi:perosamine synthetase